MKHLCLNQLVNRSDLGDTLLLLKLNIDDVKMALKQLTEAAELYKHIEYGAIPSEACVGFFSVVVIQFRSSRYVIGTLPRWFPRSPMSQSESIPGTLLTVITWRRKHTQLPLIVGFPFSVNIVCVKLNGLSVLLNLFLKTVECTLPAQLPSKCCLLEHYLVFRAKIFFYKLWVLKYELQPGAPHEPFVLLLKIMAAPRNSFNILLLSSRCTIYQTWNYSVIRFNQCCLCSVRAAFTPINTFCFLYIFRRISSCRNSWNMITGLKHIRQAFFSNHSWTIYTVLQGDFPA